ncbi:MAG: dehydrogenase E1 component subunit alpha/beta [Candidatus Kapaibacterium sp.]|nr:dehydrogenase E1 component subunit alpha/beta [Ignavibacteriota bacterium]MCB9221205.1 dehydrogenase [Ignavibacteria bacterium]
MASNNNPFDYNKYQTTNEEKLELYRNILLPRMIEEKMILLLRQNRISKWFSGIGQEAISVGSTMAMLKDEYILPMHRNLGVFTSRNMPLKRLFSQFQGKANGYTKGRDRSFHFGSIEDRIIGMISHLGPQLSIANGLSLAKKLNSENKGTLVFTGDGGTSEGEFHEALNLAAVWKLPVIFLVENNGYGLSTPSSEQFAMKDFVSKGPGYGIKAQKIDGNNILEVYETVKKIMSSMRKNPEPFLLECITFRMRGHEESSGTKYIPQELFDEWAKKDPVVNYEKYLLENNIITQDSINRIRQEFSAYIDEAVDSAFEEPVITVDSSNEYADVYKPSPHITITPQTDQKSEKRFIEAISDGLYQAMEQDKRIILMGQDIAEYGGAFKVTQGFLEKFGRDRVRNTPIIESGAIGAALGLAIEGFKPIVEMQFSDFVTCGFNQIVNNLAKLNYRWGQNADVLIRMPTGAGVGAGPFHSQSTEGWFFQTPGLKLVYPSNPTDAKGLLVASINEVNPVLYFEHKALYRSIKEEIYDNIYSTEIGKGNYIKHGNTASIITYGLGVHWAKEIVERNNLDIEIVDLRTLLPFDKDIIEETIKKTNRVLLLQEDTFTGGVMAELSAYITENLFDYLDAPVVRVGSLDTPVPFATELEANFLASARLEEKLNFLLNY